jgi:hypothetical protein
MAGQILHNAIIRSVFPIVKPGAGGKAGAFLANARRAPRGGRRGFAPATRLTPTQKAQKAQNVHESHAARPQMAGFGSPNAAEWRRATRPQTANTRPKPPKTAMVFGKVV